MPSSHSVVFPIPASPSMTIALGHVGGVEESLYRGELEVTSEDPLHAASSPT
jgi:hypothetical protein